MGGFVGQTPRRFAAAAVVRALCGGLRGISGASSASLRRSTSACRLATCPRRSSISRLLATGVCCATLHLRWSMHLSSCYQARRPGTGWASPDKAQRQFDESPRRLGSHRVEATTAGEAGRPEASSVRPGLVATKARGDSTGMAEMVLRSRSDLHMVEIAAMSGRLAIGRAPWRSHQTAPVLSVRLFGFGGS